MSSTARNAQAISNVLRDLRTMERGLIEASQVVGDFRNALETETEDGGPLDAAKIAALRHNIALRLATLNAAVRSVQDDAVRTMLHAADLTAEGDR